MRWRWMCRRGPMQPHEFISKWQAGSPAHDLNERAGARPYVVDLCRLPGVSVPGNPENCCRRTDTGLSELLISATADARAPLGARAIHVADTDRRFGPG
jgi:hypothetical protein